MYRIQKSKIKLVLIAVCVFMINISANPQCAMCRAALTNQANKNQAQAVNDGIVYLMIIPYLLVAGIGFYIYRMMKIKKQSKKY